LSYFKETLVFWTVFRRHTAISNFIDILPVGADFYSSKDKGQTDRQKDMVNLKHLSQFCERARKKRISILSGCLELAFLALLA
jgi:hypothetical protein